MMKKIMIIAALMLASTMMYGQLKVVKHQKLNVEWYVLEVGDYRFDGPSVEQMAKRGTGEFTLNTESLLAKYSKEYGKVLNKEERYEYARAILEYFKENETIIEEKYDVVISTISDVSTFDGTFSFYCHPKNVDELVNAREEKIRREKETLKANISELISKNVL